MQITHYEPKRGNERPHARKPGRRTRKKNLVVCPYCHDSDEVIPILYGLPSHDDFRRADRGEVYLGGCEITPYSHYCKRDEKEF